MSKVKYKYIIYNQCDTEEPIAIGTAKEVAKNLFIDKSCIHRAARSKRLLARRYIVKRENIK